MMTIITLNEITVVTGVSDSGRSSLALIKHKGGIIK